MTFYLRLPSKKHSKADMRTERCFLIVPMNKKMCVASGLEMLSLFCIVYCFYMSLTSK